MYLSHVRFLYYSKHTLVTLWRHSACCTHAISLKGLEEREIKLNVGVTWCHSAATEIKVTFSLLFACVLHGQCKFINSVYIPGSPSSSPLHECGYGTDSLIGMQGGKNSYNLYKLYGTPPHANQYEYHKQVLDSL